MKKLFYNAPAKVWNEALPLGNGRLGAMVYGDPFCDCFAMNEDTLWSGYPRMEEEPHSMEAVEEIRQLIAQGKYIAADRKTAETMHNFRCQMYMSYGKLFVQIAAANSRLSGYRRELNLETGVHKTCYELDGNRIQQTSFVSLADDLLVIRIESEKKIGVKFSETVDLEHSVRTQGDTLNVTGRCPTEARTPDKILYDDRESVQFSSVLKVLSNGGAVFGGGGCCEAKGTTQVVALFSLCTSFNGFDKMPVSQGKEYIERSKKIIANAEALGYEALLQRHIAKYQSQFDRVELTLDGENYDHIPTDQRIRAAAAGTVDNKLVELLFDYARYLTIAGSQPETQAMNLQGIWNDSVMPPWHSNYTININTEMNYWHAERCNLPECHEPLMDMLRELRSRGNVFGLRGWNCWHNTDIWRFHHEATDKTLYGYWPMGGFWLCRHIWEHYAHTQDKAFLEEFYPVLEEAAWFLEDWMYEKDGYLTTCPAASPENEYLLDGEKAAVCEGSAMDMQIIRDLFDKLIKAGKELGKDTAHYEEILCKLKPTLIGEDGRILEWGAELSESEMGHRHISHLYGFHPADVLTGEEWAAAVKKTLDTRLENGGGYTGWSNAWVANVYARLLDGEKVWHRVQTMFAKSIYPNMFDAHPPFQIDGNFGICAAICEALIQDHTGEIRLLPALPKAWASGSVRGFITRTGESISFRWEDGKLVESEIKPRC